MISQFLSNKKNLYQIEMLKSILLKKININ